MTTHHFVSYSAVDGFEFAQRLCAALAAATPPETTWLDKERLRVGYRWDGQLVDAIRECETVLFVMTRDSVDDRSVCTQEWSRGLKYKKPILPLLVHRDAEMPFRLDGRQHVNFTGDFDKGVAKLVADLAWRRSPEGVLQGMRERMKDAERDLRRANDPASEARVRAEIADLERQSAELSRVLADPKAAAARVDEVISRGFAHERNATTPARGSASLRFINPPPSIAPIYFQDRHVETKLVGDFLKDDSRRLLVVVGRPGVGKTAMVCRVLKALENGQMPDGGETIDVDGIVYLSSEGARRITVPNVFSDLCKLLPEPVAAQMAVAHKDPQTTTDQKMRLLLGAFPQGRTLLLMDNFEDIVDPTTTAIRDPELSEALRAHLNAPHHGVKVIITTRLAPRDLMLVQPGRQARLELDKGLESPYAERLLQQMDADGSLGLRDGPPALLDEARRRTQGYPRALEALYAILSADRYTTLQEILGDTRQLLPENVVEALVGEAFNRLDTAAERVMQALAIFGRPATPAAVDFLLKPHAPGQDSTAVLNRLVVMHFASKDKNRYYVHPVDRAYAFRRIPVGKPEDRRIEDDPPFTQYALLHRGAGYFHQVRKPRETWTSIDDVAPQIAEFELRLAGHDGDMAAQALLDIAWDLDRWGYYRLVIDLFRRAVGGVTNDELRIVCHRMLGWAWYRIARYIDALEALKVALDLAEAGVTSADPDVAVRRKWDRSAVTGEVANVYGDLGQPHMAAALFESAVRGVRELGDHVTDGSLLNNLAFVLADLGEMERAAKTHEEALNIDIEAKNATGALIARANLGARTNDLGDRATALKLCEESRKAAVAEKFRYGESVCQTYIGEILADGEEWEAAIAAFTDAATIADETVNPQFAVLARAGLARAHLCTGDLTSARVALDPALKLNVPRTNHLVLALDGVIALRAKDPARARAAFESSLAKADALTTDCDRNWRAFEAKALALAGLALVTDDDRFVDRSIAAWQSARAITRAAGICARAVRTLSLLGPADPRRRLERVREAVVC